MSSVHYQNFLRTLGYIAVRASKKRADTPSDITHVLRNARRRRRLTLVVGAGVSYDSKIPDWRCLVSRAIDCSLIPALDNDMSKLGAALGERLTTAVRFMEEMLESKAAFRHHLLHALYEKLDLHSKNETLDSVARFVCGLDGGTPITDIITYNFDDLLEERIKEHIALHSLPLKVVSLTRRSHTHSTSQRTIRVHHVHGYLPRPTSANADHALSEPIVLSERDFHHHYSNPRTWANVTQLRRYSTTSCLFIGLSFTDANLRRCLDAVQKRKPTLPQAYQHGAIIRPKLSDLSGNAAKLFLTTDLRSLRVEPIWIENFDDVPIALSHVIA